MREIDLIDEILQCVEDYILGFYESNEELKVLEKDGAADLLTNLDLGVQTMIVEKIEDVYGDALVGEEGGCDLLPKDIDGRCWVIDPIDGTWNFVRSLMPSYAVSIAFVEKGVPQAAGVLIPALRKVYLAERGEGAWVIEDEVEKKLMVSGVKCVGEAGIEIDIGNPDMRERIMGLSEGVLRVAAQVRCLGSAVVGMCSVAEGCMDGYLHAGLQPWDLAAAMLLIEEAGGVVTRLNGDAVHLFDGRGGVIGGNARVHAEMLQLVGHGEAD